MSFAFPWSSNRTTRTGLRLAALFFIMVLVGMSVANASTPNPTPQNVSNDPGVNSIWPKVAQGPNGNVHVVWDSAQNGHTILYAKGTWNGTSYSFGSPQVVGAGHPTGFALPAVGVAPNGIIMVAWSNQDKVMTFRTWNSDDAAPGGVPISLSGGIQPTIAVDSESDFHLAWSGNFDVQYREYSPTRGILSTAVFGQEVQSAPDIAVDTSNNTHVVWQRSGQIVQYSARAANAGSFGPIETIAGGTAPQITSDGLGNVHIVRSQNNDVIYCRKRFNTGCGDNRTIDAATDLQPSIAATRAGSVFIVLRAAGAIYYDAFENNAWQTTRELPGSGGGVQVDVSQRPYSSRVSIVWSEGFDIRHNFARTTPGVICGAGEAVTDEAVTVMVGRYKIYLPMITNIIPPPPPEC